MNRFWESSDASGLADVIDAMAQTCTNWQTRILLAGERSSSTHRFILRPWGHKVPQSDIDLVCEVDLQFLLLQFLAAVEPIHPAAQESRLRKLAKTLTKPVAIIRSIMEDNECYLVRNQQPCQDVLHLLLDPSIYRTSCTLQRVRKRLTSKPSSIYWLRKDKGSSSSLMMEYLALHARRIQSDFLTAAVEDGCCL